MGIRLVHLRGAPNVRVNAKIQGFLPSVCSHKSRALAPTRRGTLNPNKSETHLTK